MPAVPTVAVFLFAALVLLVIPGPAVISPRRLPQLFAPGFLVNLLNPKTALFFFAFLPQFVHPARGDSASQILVLGALFLTMATCTDGLYALLAGTAGRWLQRNARFRQVRRYVTGSVYIGLGLTAAFAGAEKH